MQGDNPIGKDLHPENLQTLQATYIQALILSLQLLIPTGTAPNDPAPQQEHAAITQEEDDPTTPPTPIDADVDK